MPNNPFPQRLNRPWSKEHNYHGRADAPHSNAANQQQNPRHYLAKIFEPNFLSHHVGDNLSHEYMPLLLHFFQPGCIPPVCQKIRGPVRATRVKLTNYQGGRGYRER